MDNQTEELWLLNISIVDKGTGLFVFPLSHALAFGLTNWETDIPSSIYGPLKKALVKDVTYLECAHHTMRDDIIVFKWIPESLASFDDVKKSALSCGSVICEKRCAKYGCACIAGECK